MRDMLPLNKLAAQLKSHQHTVRAGIATLLMSHQTSKNILQAEKRRDRDFDMKLLKYDFFEYIY